MNNAQIKQVLENCSQARKSVAPMVIITVSHRSTLMNNDNFEVATVRRCRHTDDLIPNTSSVDDFSSYLALPKAQCVKVL